MNKSMADCLTPKDKAIISNHFYACHSKIYIYIFFLGIFSENKKKN